NNSIALATQLGPVVAPRQLTHLTLAPGEDDAFQFRTLDVGTSTITVTSNDAADLELQLFDVNGTSVQSQLVELRDNAGNLTGNQLTAPPLGFTNYPIFVHQPVPANSPSFDSPYPLPIQSLTADLGTTVHQLVNGVVESVV